MQIHGILNTVAWGIILPLGVLIARYIKSLDPSSPAWFHGHRICQSIGYVLGAVGFALGLKLGNESEGITHQSHRAMAIAVFCLSTFQVCFSSYSQYISILTSFQLYFYLITNYRTVEPFNFFLINLGD